MRNYIQTSRVDACKQVSEYKATSKSKQGTSQAQAQSNTKRDHVQRTNVIVRKASTKLLMTEYTLLLITVNAETPTCFLRLLCMKEMPPTSLKLT
jgi:hypothetical protein